MRTPMATRPILCIISAILLMSAIAPGADAAVTIEIGDYRDLALQFVKEKFDLSEDAARSVMRQYEVMHGDRVINTLELPDGAVLDFVTVDGQAADPDCAVTYEGSGVLRQAKPQLFGQTLSDALNSASPAERQKLLDTIAAAVDRGWFVQEITEQQRANLLNYRLPGDEGVMRTQQARNVRILVVLNNFPRWDDRSPTRSLYDEPRSRNRPGEREHPMHSQPLTQNLYTPGGPLSTSDYQPAGPQSPSWSNTGETHPRIEYTVEGRKGTSIDLRERWYDFLFNQDNPVSVTNYYWANSNGNLRIQGNRSDVRGPLESKHMLDRVPYGQAGFDYAIQPGTPIIERVPQPDTPPYPGVPNLRGLSADSGEDIVGTLGYSSGVSIARVDVLQDDGTWDQLDIDAVRVDPYDSRRRIYEVEGFDSDDVLRVRIGAQWIQFQPDRGFSLSRDQSRTTFTTADILGSSTGNRLLSMCYYTHDHNAINGEMGSRPYQLAHVRNTAGVIDDICGTVEDSRDRRRRPFPYDHDTVDHNNPNFGYFTGGSHNYQTWLNHLNTLMVEEGVSPASYDRTIHLYPSDSAGGPDQPGTSGPWSGGHVFIPNSAVVLPSDAGLVLTAHELGHALMGWPDLYDWDWYANMAGHQPPLDVTNMMGPYSLMARAGGVRVDAFLKTLSGWVTPVAVTTDIVRAELPAIEGMLQDPVVYKLPGRPHYIATGVPPDQWEEFFLVENRNRRGAEYFGDPSPQGMYIYHVDLRFPQTNETHPMVIVEQADGLYELERNREGVVGDLEGDPFPGSHDVRNWTQYTNPGSHSHGFKAGTLQPNQVSPALFDPPEPAVGQLVNGTETDSFTRVVNISDPGSMMRADLHVVPREVIVTSVPIPDRPVEVQQGTEDFLIKHLNFNNDGDLPNFSMGDVEIASLRIDESGSSQRDADIERVSLFDDTNGNGVFDPEIDTRIATADLQNGTAFFTNLNYRVPLHEQRDIFVTYDISPTANPARGNSIGAGIQAHDYVRPKVPGAVQERRRTQMTADSAGLAQHRFPLISPVARVLEDPDTLTITAISRAPVDTVPGSEPGFIEGMAIEPGDTDVPILSLNMTVDQDSVIVNRVMVDQTGTMNGVAHITSAKLYLDTNADGEVGPADMLLEETTFASVAGTQRAVFDLGSDPIEVVEGVATSLLLTASISQNMPLVEPPLTLQYTLADTSYIGLSQYSDDPAYHDVVSDENFPLSSDVVSTPVPNEPPAAPENLAAEVLADGSVLLTWDLSADDPAVGGEEDVVHYNVYRSTDPADFLDVSPIDAIATVPAGETQYNDLTAPLSTPVFYMMRAWDGVQEGPNSNIAGPVQATDNVPPTFSEFDPAQGADGVPLDSTIAFTITDTGSGVDRTTLVFEVDGVDVADAPETTISGPATRLRVVYDPPEDFDFLQKVAVRLQVSDNAGNESDVVSYDFTATGPPVHFIAGFIADSAGNPEANVRVEAGGLFAMTDADGEYRIEGLSAGTYSVVPSKQGRSFQPHERSVTVPPDAVAVDFTSQAGFEISGSVVTEDGDPLAGVSVTDGMHIDVTGADGLWQFTGVPAGTYDVIAQLDGWSFAPASIEVTVSTEAGDSTGNQFVASEDTYTVAGTVRTLAGDRLAGILVQARQDGATVATATTNANGAYSIAGLAPGSYTIRPVDADYAFDPTQRDVDVASDLANIDFSAAARYAMTLPAGLNFVSVPVQPMDATAAAVFGENVQVARWDPQTGAYITAPSTNPLLEVKPGAGFWTRSAQQAQLGVPGTLFPSTQDLSLTVRRTWNMLGNPYDRDLPWERMGIGQDSPVSIYGFIYDAGAGTYRLVTTAPGLGAVTTVPKKAGFWLRTAATTQVTINAPGSNPASAEVAEAAARKPAADAWIIPIVARAAGALDACNYAGVLPQAAGNPAAYQMDNPPAVGPYVDLYFLGDGGRRLAVDVRENRPVQTWQFEVATDMADVEVQVQMPDLSEVPADKSVYLIDETAGKRMYARTLTTYSYQSGEGARRFSLEVADRSEVGLMITSASAQAAGGGITVSYTLSADAQVQVEVLNIAGRKIATLATGEAAPAGISTCGWNGRGAGGTLVPSGRYLVRVSARADDGQQVQALVPVQLQR
ncbi:MAG: carboxypeptidase regulatory-like domain-containing protein [Armatimonadota bacterium]